MYVCTYICAGCCFFLNPFRRINIKCCIMIRTVYVMFLCVHFLSTSGYPDTDTTNVYMGTGTT